MTQAATFDPIPETVDDALAKWDAGESVFSVEMGGIGPGYEMAIQGLAFEMMRVIKDVELPPVGCEIPEATELALDKRLDDVASRCDKEPWGGFSGAQVGAAKNIAMCVCRRGYRNALRDEAVKDRLIQVSKKDLRD
jgi:hypothetical protein